METRGRGRDARSTVDESPSVNANTTASTPAVRTPSTRSRTRVRIRATRASSTSSFPPEQTPTSFTRPRRFSTVRRAAQSQASSSSAISLQRQAPASSAASPPQLQVTSSPGRPLATRKRTRSSSRRQSGHSPASGHVALSGHPHPRSYLHSTAAQSSAVTAALATPPLKRPRRTAQGTRSPRLPHLTSGGRSSIVAGSSRRASNDMNPTNDVVGREGDESEQRGGNDGSSSLGLGSDRAGPHSLQGLLRRLGADLGDIFPGSVGISHARLQQLRSAVSTPANTEQQIDALSELCEFLSVGTEESLVSFSVNLFVSPLVNLLRNGTNIEIKIYAARALTHMMEALPSSSSSIANHGAAGPLCQNLLSIEYIDLAEQSLSALHKLSFDYPQQIVSANGFQAVLSFIDFFSLGVQRIAAATACNLCRLPRADAMDMISGGVPTMMRLLDSEDQRIRESAVLGFTRLAESFRNVSAKLEALCGEHTALVEKVLGLVVPSSPPALSPQSCASALRLLAILSRGSAALGLQILSTKSLVRKLHAGISSGSTLHSVDCLALADSLLPDIPELEGTQGSSGRPRRRRTVGSTAAFAAVDIKRREDLEKNMEPLQFFGQTVFATLMKFYFSSADANARRLALSTMSKYVSVAHQSVLLDVVMERGSSDTITHKKSGALRFCTFVAALLGENSTRHETLFGLALADSALLKVPSLRESFIREGVVHEIVRLTAFGGEAHGHTEGPDRPAENRCPLSDTAAAVENRAKGASRSSSRQISPNSATAGVESVWGAVAALQRGSEQRASRGDFVSVPRHVLAGSLDMRFADTRSLQALVPNVARSILRTHLGAQEDGSMDEAVFQNTILGSLKKIRISLRTTKSPRDEAKGVEALSSLVELLSASHRLTVFEISKSGIMEALAEYLAPSDTELKSSRIVSLVTCLNKDKGRGAFSHLVDLALGVLSSEEKLPVRTNESSVGTVSSSAGSGLRQLAQPFKLRLRRASGDRGNLRDYSHHVVLIEPLATMASVQAFLWPRVRESDSGNGAIPLITPRRRCGQQRDSRTRENFRAPNQDDEVATPASGDGINTQADEDVDHDRYAEEAIFDMEEDNNDDDERGDEGDSNEVEGVDDGNSSDPSDEDVSSGEEDVIERDVGGSSDQEVDGGEAFDVDQLSTSLPAFELDHDTLGQVPSLLTRPQNGSPRDAVGTTGSASRQSSNPATTFRSYAAALAANMPRSFDCISVSGMERNEIGRSHGSARADGVANAKVAPGPKLFFVLNGKAVPHDCSILSAVIQTSGEDRGLGAHLWSDVHTLVYSKAEVQPSVGGSATQRIKRGTSSGQDSVRGSMITDGTSGVRRSQRLLENRGKGQASVCEEKIGADMEEAGHKLPNIVISNEFLPVPRSVQMSELPASVASVIEVLRQLHWIYENMNGSNVRSGVVPSAHEVLREDADLQFYSHKLSAKLVRQLSDPLALCGGVVPSWCFSLSRDASFLIPFEARRVLFQSTSLGVARALHLLQSRVDVSAVAVPSHRGSRGRGENETRIGRIQRQKVRLHRSRILESAIKVMSIYGAHATVLEVEYFHEAGTGLGPTLEFYTLVSREVQRVDLGLWRSNSANLSEHKSQNVERHAVVARSTLTENLYGRTVTRVKRRSRRHVQNAPRVAEIIVSDEESPAYVIPTGKGLFPSCLPIVSSESQKEAIGKSTPLYRFIGRLLGKAMIDGRLLDLRFSRTFSRLLLAYCRVFYENFKLSDNARDRRFNTDTEARHSFGALDSEDREEVWNVFLCGTSAMQLLEDVDTQLACSLMAIANMVRGGQEEAVEGLCLTFVLPGDDEVELVKNGKDRKVTSKNAEEFVQRVIYHVLFGGVQQQTEALLQGLGEVLDVTTLLSFKSDELDLLICGPSFEKWTIDFLIEATRCDHGYSHESLPVMYFLRILSEMAQGDQQRFITFATGSPALPLGGLKNLHPRLTIVRRTPEAGRSPDECLPTVMTCTNYFKLPEYSSLDITRKQVMYAVREGQGAFHLS